MGYSIQAINKYNESAAYFHYPETDRDRPLHKVLGIKTDRQDKIEKTYSIGDILRAKSELLKVSNTLEEQDFCDKVLLDMKETNVKNIQITFN